MRCVLCNESGITEGDEALGLCSAHDQAFRSEAAEVAEAVKRDEPGAEKTAFHMIYNKARLRLRVERAQEQQQAAPSKQEQRSLQPGILEDYK